MYSETTSKADILRGLFGRLWVFQYTEKEGAQGGWLKRIVEVSVWFWSPDRPLIAVNAEIAGCAEPRER